MLTLSIRNCSKSYGKILALDGFSADLTPGIHALLGPNGSGKTTLMNLITDNLKADRGEIALQIDGEEPKNTLKMGAAFREMIGFMPQYPEMPPYFSVECYLWYMAALKGIGDGLKRKEKKARVAAAVEAALRAVELQEERRRRIITLSGGMKQRLALAGAILGEPRILILDEPTAGLDPRQRIAVRNLLSGFASDRIILIATHVVSDIEPIAANVFFLKKGVLADCGSPRSLTRKTEGKVWELPASPEDAEEIKKRFPVTGIRYDGGTAILRVLSQVSPAPDARPVPPTLEDAYLSVFGPSPETA